MHAWKHVRAKEKEMTANWKRKRQIIYLLFVLPALFFFVLSIIYPFLSGLKISMTDWNGVSRDMNYVGIRNYVNIFRNKDIVNPIRNTVLYAVMVTVVGNLVSLLMALAINRGFRGRSFCRTAFFLPTSISTVLAVFIWGFMFRDVFHNLFGIKSLIGNKRTVLIGVAVIKMWTDVGVNMLVYLSSLTTVPTELYESAALDGAGVIQQFFHVTLPMIVPAFTTCITLSLTYGLKEFSTPYVATGGGPAGASETITIYIYKHLMSYNKAGYGQAVATVFTVILIIIGALTSGLLRRKEVEL